MLAGDIIAITLTKGTTEKFCVLSYDESTQKAKVLVKYNLVAGEIYNSSKIRDAIMVIMQHNIL